MKLEGLRLLDKFILALETSSSICGASILLNDELLSIEEKNTSRQHAELLPDLTKSSLKKINKTLDDINAIAISIWSRIIYGIACWIRIC